MATLIAAATGNFTTNTTWGTVDSTSLLDSEANSTALTSSYALSSTFTPGAITIDGIAVKLASVSASPTGTISVALDQATTTVTGTEVTLNVSDLPSMITSTTTNEGGWILFKFAAPVLLVAATAYSVKAKTSNATQVSLYRNATTSNWSRLLRTTTNATPGAGDILHIIGEHTGAGTGNSFTVTMNETATTDYGPGTDGLVAMTIGKRGTLTYGTTGATNYYLKLSGDLIGYNNGTLNIGTTGTPIPRNSTAVLEFDPVADGGMGLIARNGFTFVVQGLSRTSAKNVIVARLNTDEAANSTSLGVDTDTGWLDNDEIAVASTTRTSTQTEKGTLNGNANTSDITVDGFAGTGGGLLNAHSGTSPTQAEVILITRNVTIRSATSTVMTYVNVKATASVDIDWARFRYLGENATGKRGIEIETTTGSFNMQFSTIDDCEDWGIYITGGSANNVTISNNCFYNLDSAAVASTRSFNIDTTSGSAITVSGNYWLACSCASNDRVVFLQDVGLTFTNNTIAGSGNGSTSNAVEWSESNLVGTHTGNTAHSNAGRGFRIASGAIFGTIGTSTAWRNTGNGLEIGAGTYGLIFDTASIFGNTSPNIQGSGGGLNITLKNFTVNSDASFTVAQGLFVNGNGTIRIIDSVFSGVSAHTGQDISIQNNGMVVIDCYNCTFSAATQASIQTGGSNTNQRVRMYRNGQTDAHKTYYSWGVISSNTSVRHTASGFSWQLTPANAVQKLIIPGPQPYDGFRAAVNASSLVTIKIWVQKDGTYNGNAPRLVLIGGVTSGIASDVTASLTVGANTWEELTVTGTPNAAGAVEFYVDCDGTAGNVYVDDITISQA